MSKPRAVKWLEKETGERLERRPVVGDDGRHLSVRVPASLFADIEQMASGRGESVSHAARRLLEDGVARAKNPDREAIDTAIATLEQLRRRLR